MSLTVFGSGGLVSAASRLSGVAATARLDGSHTPSSGDLSRLRGPRMEEQDRATDWMQRQQVLRGSCRRRLLSSSVSPFVPIETGVPEIRFSAAPSQILVQESISDPQLAALDNGLFVAVWERRSDTGLVQTVRQLFDSDLKPTSDIQPLSESDSFQSAAALCPTPSGHAIASQKSAVGGFDIVLNWVRNGQEMTRTLSAEPGVYMTPSAAYVQDSLWISAVQFEFTSGKFQVVNWQASVDAANQLQVSDKQVVDSVVSLTDPVLVSGNPSTVAQLMVSTVDGVSDTDIYLQLQQQHQGEWRPSMLMKLSQGTVGVRASEPNGVWVNPDTLLVTWTHQTSETTQVHYTTVSWTGDTWMIGNEETFCSEAPICKNAQLTGLDPDYVLVSWEQNKGSDFDSLGRVGHLQNGEITWFDVFVLAAGAGHQGTVQLAYRDTKLLGLWGTIRDSGDQYIAGRAMELRFNQSVRARSDVHFDRDVCPGEWSSFSIATGFEDPDTDQVLQYRQVENGEEISDGEPDQQVAVSSSGMVRIQAAAEGEVSLPQTVILSTEATDGLTHAQRSDRFTFIPRPNPPIYRPHSSSVSIKPGVLVTQNLKNRFQDPSQVRRVDVIEKPMFLSVNSETGDVSGTVPWEWDAPVTVRYKAVGACETATDEIRETWHPDLSIGHLVGWVGDTRSITLDSAAFAGVRSSDMTFSVESLIVRPEDVRMEAGRVALILNAQMPRNQEWELGIAGQLGHQVYRRIVQVSIGNREPIPVQDHPVISVPLPHETLRMSLQSVFRDLDGDSFRVIVRPFSDDIPTNISTGHTTAQIYQNSETDDVIIDSGIAAGNYTLTAFAQDSFGGRSQSIPITFHILEQPLTGSIGDSSVLKIVLASIGSGVGVGVLIFLGWKLVGCIRASQHHMPVEADANRPPSDNCTPGQHPEEVDRQDDRDDQELPHAHLNNSCDNGSFDPQIPSAPPCPHTRLPSSDMRLSRNHSVPSDLSAAAESSSSSVSQRRHSLHATPCPPPAYSANPTNDPDHNGPPLLAPPVPPLPAQQRLQRGFQNAAASSTTPPPPLPPLGTLPLNRIAAVMNANNAQPNCPEPPPYPRYPMDSMLPGHIHTQSMADPSRIPHANGNGGSNENHNGVMDFQPGRVGGGLPLPRRPQGAIAPCESPSFGNGLHNSISITDIEIANFDEDLPPKQGERVWE